MDSDRYDCPVCGQPVEAVVRRYKTLGAWVPTWVPGPCRNPRCEASTGRSAGAEARPATAEPSRGATTDNP
ncbi:MULTISPECIES: hypothetical protein [Streptomyces]|uniref:Uncharacterized protein n=1 Tax=Streptomyces lienomycini TaxID=284035 RepID=A0ABV9WQJ5_9ACTN|nr:MULTISPECIES: hypothetical protein [Streptomyces]